MRNLLNTIIIPYNLALLNSQIWLVQGCWSIFFNSLKWGCSDWIKRVMFRNNPLSGSSLRKILCFFPIYWKIILQCSLKISENIRRKYHKPPIIYTLIRIYECANWKLKILQHPSITSVDLFVCMPCICIVEDDWIFYDAILLHSYHIFNTNILQWDFQSLILVS